VSIGITVQILPLAHPRHLAEDVATVDQLSKGRLDLGVDRGALHEGKYFQYGSGSLP